MVLAENRGYARGDPRRFTLGCECTPSSFAGKEVTVTDAGNGDLIGLGRVPAEPEEFGELCRSEVYLSPSRAADFYRIEVGPEGDPIWSARVTHDELRGRGFQIDVWE